MKYYIDNLFKNCGKLVFTDKYGFCKVEAEIILNNMSLSKRNIFVYDKNDKTYKKLYEKDVYSAIVTLLSSKLTIWNVRSYSTLPDTIPAKKANTIELQSLFVHLRIIPYEYDFYSKSLKQKSYSYGGLISLNVELKNLSDLDKYICYVSDDFSKTIPLYPIDYSLLKEGDEVYFINKRKVKVSKMYEFPNKDNKVCEVVNSENEPTTILFSERRLYYLPFNEPKSLLDEIDDAKNELLLLPRIAKSETHSIYNVYWKPIKDAARYIVSLYKQFEEGNKYNIYHLADYDIDRNTHYLALENLVGGNFIFKVTAEDRNGEVIAKSRGIEVKNKNHSQLVC